MEGIRQALAVAVVFGLLAAVLAWLRRKGAVRLAGSISRGRGRRIESVERVVLAPGHSLHLIRWEGQALLIAAGPGNCVLLETRPWREKPAEAEDRR